MGGDETSRRTERLGGAEPTRAGRPAGVQQVETNTRGNTLRLGSELSEPSEQAPPSGDTLRLGGAEPAAGDARSWLVGNESTTGATIREGGPAGAEGWLLGNDSANGETAHEADAGVTDPPAESITSAFDAAPRETTHHVGAPAPSRAAAVPAPFAGPAPGVPVDRAAERREALKQTVPAAALLAAGVLVLLVGPSFGHSALQGTANLFSLVLDALGLAAVVTGGLRLLRVLSGRFGRKDLRAGAPTLVLSYVAAFALNQAVARDWGPTDAAADVSARATEPPREARRFLQAPHRRLARMSRERGRALVEAAYAAGAREVRVEAVLEVGGRSVAGRVVIALPDDARVRDAVSRAVRRALGDTYELLPPRSRVPPDAGPWVLQVAPEALR